ncbi:MAG: hypothetical protein WC596_04050 [Candidatus Shapirobacteria bacterium]
MQLPQSWKVVIPRSKLFLLIFFLLFSFLSFYLGYRYGNSKSVQSTKLLNDSKSVISKTLPTIYPVSTLSQSRVGQMGVVPSNTKHVSYRQGNSIYLRDIIDNKLSQEKKITTASSPVNYYQFSQDLKYVAYIQYSGTKPENLNEMSGSGDEVVLVNTTTGESKIVLSKLTAKNLAATLSFANNSKKLFIGLDNNDIYSYSIGENLLTKVYSDSTVKPNSFCSGFSVVDESPNTKYLIVDSRCYEGTTTFLYNLDSKTFTKIGGGYAEGRHINKFINDNEIYGFDYGENNEKYLKLNLSGGIIQELPRPTDIPKPFFGLYDDYQTKEIFLAEESKSIIPHNVGVDGRQIIGVDVKDIFFYSSP